MTQDDPEVSTFEWTPPGVLPPDPKGAPTLVPGDLADDLLQTVENRGLTAADLVRRVARDSASWLREEGCADAGVGQALLEFELAGVREAHAWRGPVARFFQALESVRARVQDDGGPLLREALGDECGHWSDCPSKNLPDRGRSAAALLESDPMQPATGLETGEVILIHGWSETVARGVELACARGQKPRLLVSEGGPDLGGRRLARRLVAGGLAVQFIYDAALAGALRHADRIWIGTEAIGADAFIGRVGTRSLLEQAREMDLPAVVLTTSDKFMPNGTLELPTWPAEEPWHLWEGAPHGVTVESQSFESVPLALPSLYALETGLRGAAELTRRAATPAGARRV